MPRQAGANHAEPYHGMGRRFNQKHRQKTIPYLAAPHRASPSLARPGQTEPDLASKW